MKLMNQKLRYNLQFFAGKGDDGDADDNGGDDGDDDQDEDDADEEDSKSKKSEKKPKTFTQDELDKAIERRLKREREKAKKAEKEKDKTPEDKNADAAKAQAEKVSTLEAKLLCFEHDVAKDSVSDVVALARAYVDEDTDFEEAIEKVIKKYPQFKKGTSKKSQRDKDDDYDDQDEDDDDEDENDNKSWGKRQTGKKKKVDGVEAAFLKKNKGLKIDD